MTRQIRKDELLKTYDENMWCFVRDIRVCHDTGIGMLVTQSHSNPDMAACIEHFLDLKPNIKEIQVFDWHDGVTAPDTCYRCIDGVWHSFVYKRQPRKYRQTH